MNPVQPNSPRSNTNAAQDSSDDVRAPIPGQQGVVLVEGAEMPEGISPEEANQILEAQEKSLAEYADSLKATREKEKEKEKKEAIANRPSWVEEMLKLRAKKVQEERLQLDSDSNHPLVILDNHDALDPIIQMLSKEDRDKLALTCKYMRDKLNGPVDLKSIKPKTLEELISFLKYKELDTLKNFEYVKIDGRLITNAEKKQVYKAIATAYQHLSNINIRQMDFDSVEEFVEFYRLFPNWIFRNVDFLHQISITGRMSVDRGDRLYFGSAYRKEAYKLLTGDPFIEEFDILGIKFDSEEESHKLIASFPNLKCIKNLWYYSINEVRATSEQTVALLQALGENKENNVEELDLAGVTFKDSQAVIDVVSRFPKLKKLVLIEGLKSVESESIGRDPAGSGSFDFCNMSAFLKEVYLGIRAKGIKLHELDLNHMHFKSMAEFKSFLSNFNDLRVIKLYNSKYQTRLSVGEKFGPNQFKAILTEMQNDKNNAANIEKIDFSSLRFDSLNALVDWVKQFPKLKVLKALSDLNVGDNGWQSKLTFSQMTTVLLALAEAGINIEALEDINLSSYVSRVLASGHQDELSELVITAKKIFKDLKRITINEFGKFSNIRKDIERFLGLWEDDGMQFFVRHESVQGQEFKYYPVGLDTYPDFFWGQRHAASLVIEVS